MGMQAIAEPYRKLIDSISQPFADLAKQYEELLKLEFKPFMECGIWLAPSMTPGVIGIAVEKYEKGKTGGHSHYNRGIL
jgi:hypothetical protein